MLVICCVSLVLCITGPQSYCPNFPNQQKQTGQFRHHFANCETMTQMTKKKNIVQYNTQEYIGIFIYNKSGANLCWGVCLVIFNIIRAVGKYVIVELKQYGLWIFIIYETVIGLFNNLLQKAHIVANPEIVYLSNLEIKFRRQFKSNY